MEFSNVNDISLVIFDMDGVVFKNKNFYRDLQAEYNFDEEGFAFYKQRLAEASYETAYKEWAEKFLTGKSADKYLDMVEKRDYSVGLQPLLHQCSLRDIKTVIVSSGPDLLAERALSEMNFGRTEPLIHEFHANSMEIIDGKFTGKALVPVDDKDKSSVIMDLINENKGHIMCIGDGKPDIKIAKHADIIIAYNSSSEELSAMAHMDLPEGRLGLAHTAFHYPKHELRVLAAGF